MSAVYLKTIALLSDSVNSLMLGVRKRTIHTEIRTLTLQKEMYFCFIERPLKIMKTALYFILKSLFVLKILKLLSWIFGHAGKRSLIRKTRLTSKFMTSQSG